MYNQPSISWQPGNSLLHRLNPISKGLLSIGLIITSSLHAGSLDRTIIMLAAIFVMFFASKISIIPAISSLKKIRILLLFVFIIQYAGNEQSSLIGAVDSTLRIVCVFLASSMFISITSHSELLYFWEKMLYPLSFAGIPAKETALAMSISIRFFPVMFEEIERIKMSQQARGARLNNSPGTIAGIRSLVSIIIPLVSLSLKKADELATAMSARCYRLNQPRTSLYSYVFQMHDYLIMLSLTIFLFFILF
ncbi:MAG: energy-coupling factor transporter transmembrane protein EcfT [Candidatus Riflebacteria bacterium]|nr:energy-coupling factor transporter transmembrane protein EcfT [Candidatus Riflebacteria bacterium]